MEASVRIKRLLIRCRLSIYFLARDTISITMAAAKMMMAAKMFQLWRARRVRLRTMHGERRMPWRRARRTVGLARREEQEGMREERQVGGAPSSCVTRMGVE